jgi:outer membrane protein assembly factor BamB
MKFASRWSGLFACWLLATSVQAQDWPQWRGPGRDNKVTGFVEPKTWPKELTKKWTKSVGRGESSPVLAGEKIYVFARDEGDEILRCLDAKTGEEIWQDKYATAAVVKNAGGYPGPRSTPVVAGGKVCTLGVNGVVSCLDSVTGKLFWREDTKTRPAFNTATSPMIVGDKLIVYAAGLTAYDLTNGKVKWDWKSGNPPYGSPTLMTVGGQTEVVTPTSTILAGVSLEGQKLWDVKLPTRDYTSSYSTPLIDGPIVIYDVTMGRNPGPSKDSYTAAYKIEKTDDGLKAKELWKNNELYTDKYQSPTLVDGRYIFAINFNRQLFCMDAQSGKELWLDKTKRGECGAVLNCGSVLMALTSDRNLIAFKSSPKEFIELAKYKVGEAETWATPIVAGKRIYVRDKQGSLTLYTLD